MDKKFNATLVNRPSKGGWTYVVWPESAKFLGTRGLVKVRGTIDGYEFWRYRTKVNSRSGMTVASVPATNRFTPTP